MSIRRWGTIQRTPYSGDIPEPLKSLHMIIKPAGGAVFPINSPLVVPGSFIYQIVAPGSTQYYWAPAKVGAVDTNMGPATTTGFYSQNAPWFPGDAITVGAAAAVVASVDPVSHLITLTAALGGAPANGARVFSQTAAQNAIAGVALDYVFPISDSDQAIEYAIAGTFKKNYMDSLYAAADIAAWGAVAFPSANAYRWS